MKKNRKRASARLLSVLMTLAMIVSMLPTTAFAAEADTESDAAAAVTEQPAADDDAAQDEQKSRRLYKANAENKTNIAK